jgi:hypothetical protein
LKIIVAIIRGYGYIIHMIKNETTKEGGMTTQHTITKENIREESMYNLAYITDVIERNALEAVPALDLEIICEKDELGNIVTILQA